INNMRSVMLLLRAKSCWERLAILSRATSGTSGSHDGNLIMYSQAIFGEKHKVDISFYIGAHRRYVRHNRTLESCNTMQTFYYLCTHEGIDGRVATFHDGSFP